MSQDTEMQDTETKDTENKIYVGRLKPTDTHSYVCQQCGGMTWHCRGLDTPAKCHSCGAPGDPLPYPDKEYTLTTTKAAWLLNCTTDWVRKLAKRGTLSSLSTPYGRLFSQADIIAYAREKRSPGRPKEIKND
jgi:hypothetical protein